MLFRSADITEDKNPFITEIYDMFTRSGGNTVTSGHTIRLKGKKLKVAGSEAETGVFFAPCAEDESFSENISDWIQILQNDLIENTASILMFNLPQEITAGMYKIIIRTAYRFKGLLCVNHWKRAGHAHAVDTFFHFSPLLPDFELY